MNDPTFRVLVVDDDSTHANTCAQVIIGAGFDAVASTSAAEAMTRLKSASFALVLTDLRMPGRDGLKLLGDIRQFDPAVEVVVMTGYGSIASAVSAIRAKAFDYITKPFDKDELLNAVSRVHDVWKLQREVQQLRSMLDGELVMDGYRFKSEAMAEVYERAQSAARCDCSVVITGESGTGKEVIARAIHQTSRRSAGPFMAVNCGALPEHLIESELFGYARGAFTGADREHAGLFQAADGGTLFLDEIVEMKVSTQSKLLRCLQERAVRPVGSVKETKVDVRFIAASNTDLKAAIARQQLREDLYHRLNVITIAMPPLRSMPAEIPDLLDYFRRGLEVKIPHSITGFDKAAEKRLVSYGWPGNIREAEHLMERLCATSPGGSVSQSQLPAHIRSTASSPLAPAESVSSLSEAEHQLVVRALRVAGGNKSRAAAMLGISRPKLYKMIEQYGIRGDQSPLL
jgi:DNA-binding NtrC family response regulator